MTAPQGTDQAIAPVMPDPNSRLDQLASMYDAAKAAADAAAKELKAITDAIKLELTQARPGATQIALTSGYLARPLQLTAVTSWRLDANRMKTEAPETYARYAKRSTAWRLAPITGDN